ncbi:hypothetical protein [Maritalea myrionectae]|uniref:hypothetical protein n=1 Tax=Maritalea myrionectae TaxID=454601 RepID=UPI0003F95C11|nr:hypothetical protein [Maritalea myrionectae]
MRHFILGLFLSLGLAGGAHGQAAQPSELSAILAEQGVSSGLDYAAEQENSARKSFMLGALHTLDAVQYMLHSRYENYSGRLPLVPGGQTVLRVNPNSEFDPAFIEIGLTGALERLAEAERALADIGEDELALTIDLNDVWFDVDKDGVRAPDESMGMFMAGFFDMRQAADVELPIVQFDRADAQWLLAYTRVMQGMAEMVLSVDPTSAIKKVTDGSTRMRELGILERDPIFGDENIIDTIAIIVTALHGQPEVARTQKALTHFQGMIAANKEFWRLVALEEDDQAEWLPNPNQSSAFGVPVTKEVADGWQDVLAELDAVLAGEALVPFWRIEGRDDTQVGININKLLTNPGDFDLLLMVHGAAFAPFMEKGRVVDTDVMQRFSRMTGGQAGMFALWFN